MDIVVTVPKRFTHPLAPGKIGLAAWLAEGDAPGTPWTSKEWCYTLFGVVPEIAPGERVYVVCEGRLVGYAPLVRKHAYRGGKKGSWRCDLIRAGGAVACTIDEPITGFIGWRKVWWRREDEKPLDLSEYLR